MNRPCLANVVRHSLLAVVAGAGLAAVAGSAVAADARGVGAVRQQQQQQQQQSQPAPAPAPAPRAAPAQQAPRAAPPAAQQRGGSSQPQLRPYRGGGNNSWRTYDSDGRPAVVGPPRGSRDRGDARIVPPSRAWVARQPRTVPSLPHSHRRYDWRGSPYYWGGGHWYRPYRNSYVIVGAPYGMFMPYLPGSYTSVWVGGSRYYYADGAYFMYEPSRRGYVVTRSPYGDDEDEGDYGDEGSGGTDQDLYIYPMRGQSEQQQSDDRYECHRWAVDQTHYDPTDSRYDRDDRSEYDRALTACLTGRGYSVK